MEVLHSSLFYIISSHINSLDITPLFVLVWILHSQPLLHFSNLVITPNPFPANDVIWGLQRGGNLREQDVGCNMGEQEQPNLFLCWRCVFSYFCMIVRCRVKMDFSNVFVRSNFVETILLVFKCLNIQFWVNVLTSWRNVYQKHHLCLPPLQKKQWPWLFSLH